MIPYFLNSAVSQQYLAETMSCTVEEGANGLCDLTLTYPETGRLASELICGLDIYVRRGGNDPEPFRVYSVTKNMGATITLKAHHITYNANFLIVTPGPHGGIGAGSWIASNAKQACDLLNQNIAVDTTMEMDEIVEFVVEDEETAANIRGEYSIPAEPVSLREAIFNQQWGFLKTYGGDVYVQGHRLVWRSDLATNRSNAAIRYGVNLTDYEVKENIFGSEYQAILPYYSKTEEVSDWLEINEPADASLAIEEIELPRSDIEFGSIYKIPETIATYNGVGGNVSTPTMVVENIALEYPKKPTEFYNPDTKTYHVYRLRDVRGYFTNVCYVSERNAESFHMSQTGWTMFHVTPAADNYTLTTTYKWYKYGYHSSRYFDLSGTGDPIISAISPKEAGFPIKVEAINFQSEFDERIASISSANQYSLLEEIASQYFEAHKSDYALPKTVFSVKAVDLSRYIRSSTGIYGINYGDVVNAEIPFRKISADLKCTHIIKNILNEQPVSFELGEHSDDIITTIVRFYAKEKK